MFHSHQNHLDDDIGVENYDCAEVQSQVGEGPDIGAFLIIGDIVAGIRTACPSEVPSPLKQIYFKDYD